MPTRPPDLDEATIKAAGKFIEENGTRVSFDEAAASETLSAEQITKVKSAVSQWNSNVASAPRNATSATDTSAMATTKGGKIIYSSAHGYMRTHWWGLETYLDSYLVGKVIAGTVTAGGIAALIGVTSGVGVVAGSAVGATLGAASGAIALCKDANGAVTYHTTPLNPGNPVCNPLA